MTYPRIERLAAESALQDYLAHARELIAAAAAAAPSPDATAAEEPSTDFAHLRWFELPAVCLT
jgi:hypothetical protein